MKNFKEIFAAAAVVISLNACTNDPCKKRIPYEDADAVMNFCNENPNGEILISHNSPIGPLDEIKTCNEIRALKKEEIISIMADASVALSCPKK